jgi:hypothetical protein
VAARLSKAGIPTGSPVSGERVRLVDDGGSISRLVDALANVVGGAGGPAALIGGLALLARVGGAYRVTNDVDAVSEPDALAVVLAERGDVIGSSWTMMSV